MVGLAPLQNGQGVLPPQHKCVNCAGCDERVLAWQIRQQRLVAEEGFRPVGANYLWVRCANCDGNEKGG